MSNSPTLKKRIKKRARWMGVSFPIVAALTFVAFTLTKKQDSDLQRYPASQKDQKSFKKRVLGSVGADHGLTHTHKLRPPFELSVQPLDRDVAKPGEVLVLQAKVVSESDFESLKIFWTLPDGVNLVSGQMASVFKHIKAGEEQKVEIMIEQEDHQNYQIHVHAAAENATTQYGDVAQYNTTWQPEIDSAKTALKHRAAKHIREHRKKVKFYK